MVSDQHVVVIPDFQNRVMVSSHHPVVYSITLWYNAIMNYVLTHETSPRIAFWSSKPSKLDLRKLFKGCLSEREIKELQTAGISGKYKLTKIVRIHTDENFEDK